MPKVTFELDEHVALMTMDSGENRFNFPFFEDFNQVLDKVEQETDATVLVVKSSHSKIWSNGIDLEWLQTAIEQEGTDVLDRFRFEMWSLMRRVMALPMITVAAITGHAFAGGAFLSFAHDFRFMRSDRGWICLPEVDLKMPLGPLFTALCKRALPDYKFEEMLYTGKRLTAEECQAHNIVTKAVHIDHLIVETMAFAKSLNKGRDIIGPMKQETHKDALVAIDAAIAALNV